MSSPKRARTLLVDLPSDARPDASGGLEGTPGASDGASTTWRVPLSSDTHPWDAAHAAHAGDESATGGAPVGFVEPDWELTFEHGRGRPVRHERLGGGNACEVRRPSASWPPTDLAFGWHLDDRYSQLRRARETVGSAAETVSIGILDTGYDPNHETRPDALDLDHARNFVDADRPHDATDPAADPNLEGLLDNPGHGTATLAILAGARIRPPGFSFDDYLGGCPHARVVPIRIANSVVHFATSAMADGLDHAVAARCDVVSISMGGVPARSWAKAVNRAYEAGTAIFAAAGNNVGGLPARSLVYPARFQRVVAVCGATAAHAPYFKGFAYPGMQGNFGPRGKMRTALAAYTPNMTWAEIACGNAVSLDGAGTSSATPQAAAAAALWLARHGVPRERGWRRVEAVRHALFSSANQVPAFERQFGNGLLRANDALAVAPDFGRARSPQARVSFPWLRVLFGLETVAAIDTRAQMLEVEALQLFVESPSAQALAGGADPEEDKLDARTVRRVLEALAQEGDASETFRGEVRERVRRV